MARFTLTIEDNVDGSVELKSDQDLPFSHPERATHAELLAMYLIRTVEDGLKRKPKNLPGLVLPAHLVGRH